VNVKTKIIATVGPACEKEPVLKRMITSGMDVMRINFSHSSLGEAYKFLEAIKKINKRLRRHVRILGDLEGYRIRVGILKEKKPQALKKGQILWLSKGDVQEEPGVIPFDYTGPLNRIEKDQHIYIDDGNIDLIVERRELNRLKTRVNVPGVLKERKGLNIPGVRLDYKDISVKDRQALEFCLKERFDYIAQSFVRSKDDCLILKRYLGRNKNNIKIIAKIENRDGIINIGDIIRVADGIMVARGDMGVAIPVYEVPIVQKEIIKKCNKARKMVITATQMLESMTENLRPTRAEVTDVANAIFDGTDYVMLSAESAVGRYPVESVAMMNNIIKFTERSSCYKTGYANKAC